MFMRRWDTLSRPILEARRAAQLLSLDCQFHVVHAGRVGVAGMACMSSNELYRTQAEDCLRMARSVQNDCDRPFWLNLAQSWLQLAEHSSRKMVSSPASPPSGD